jgi:acyl carrier protein
MSNDARLRTILERLFGPEGAAKMQSGGSDAVWDSMAHINLVLAVEQDLGITFTPDEAGVITSFNSLLAVVESKLGRA